MPTAAEIIASGPDRIVLVGDLHANSAAAGAALGWAHDRGADVVVQLGDFGYGFESSRHPNPFLPRVGRFARELDLPLLWFSGNHENEDALAQARQTAGVADDEPLLLSDHVAQLPCGFRLDWGERGWLVISGATSVDRPWRLPGISWWPEEVHLTAEKADQLIAANDERPVDVIASHDAFWAAPASSRHRPSGVLASHLHWNRPLQRRQEQAPVACTKETLREADEHAKRVRQVVESVLRPDGAFFHGHMHFAYHDVVDSWRVHGLAAESHAPEAGLCLLVDALGFPIDRANAGLRHSQT